MNDTYSYNDLLINGVGSSGGGRFGRVLISGSGKVQGALECEEFRLSGAGKVLDGSLTVHGLMACSGAGRADGPILAEELRVSGAFTGEADAEVRGLAEISGSLKTEGSLKAGTLVISGICTAAGGVCANEIRSSGSLKTEGDLQAETLTASGVLYVRGLLNAGTADIQLAGEDLIGSIGGGTIRVRKRPVNFRFFQKRPHLISNLIEADEIDLEYTDAQIVRGVNVRIGPECVIDRVEYSGTLTTDADAIVREKVKV